LIDNENCVLGDKWKEVSESTDRTSLKLIDEQCVMNVTSSLENPVVFELDRKFSGGKLEISAKSEETNAKITCYALNTENANIKEKENTSYSMTVSNKNLNRIIYYLYI